MNRYLLGDILACVLLVGLVAFLVLSILGSHVNSAEFHAKCKELGGTVVHDGRQYQCLKP